MTESTEDSDINISRPQSISLPSSRHERRIALRLLDWRRCKRKLQSLRTPSPWIRDISLWLAGMSATTGFSLLTMFNVEKPNLFLKALYTTTFWASLLGALAFFLLDREVRNRADEDVDELLLDMNEIEDTFNGITVEVPENGETH